MSAYEKEVLNNKKNGKPLDDGILNFYQYSVDGSMSATAIDDIQKKINSLEGVLESKYDSSTNQFIVVTKKIDNNPVRASVKSVIYKSGYKIKMINETYYKN